MKKKMITLCALILISGMIFAEAGINELHNCTSDAATNDHLIAMTE